MWARGEKDRIGGSHSHWQLQLMKQNGKCFPGQASTLDHSLCDVILFYSDSFIGFIPSARDGQEFSLGYMSSKGLSCRCRAEMMFPFLS